jgi:hypothetical protein
MLRLAEANKVSEPLRARIGFRMAQAGAVLIALGGAGNLLIRQILPKHMFNLDLPPGGLPRPVEDVLLSAVHAAGAGLLAAGIASFYLLRLMRATNQRWIGAVVAVVVLLTDGLHALQLRQMQNPAFALAFALLLLVLAGVALCVLTRASYAPTTPATEPGRPAS